MENRLLPILYVINRKYPSSCNNINKTALEGELLNFFTKAHFSNTFQLKMYLNASTVLKNVQKTFS